MKIEMTPLEAQALFSLVLDRYREADKKSDATQEWTDVLTDETVTTETLLALLAQATTIR